MSAVVGPYATSRRTRSEPLIRLTSRVGVWGFVGGLGAMTAFTLGAPLALGAAIRLMGVGLLLSGLGIFVGSILVYRRVAKHGGPLKAGAAVGAPLGLAVSFLGATSLFLWPPMIAAVNAVTPLAGIFGIVFLVTLVIGFIYHRSTDRAPDV